jgi:hypothetical protein
MHLNPTACAEPRATGMRCCIWVKVVSVKLGRNTVARNKTNRRVKKPCISLCNLLETSIAWMSRNHGLHDCRKQHVSTHYRVHVELEKHQDIKSRGTQCHACQLLAHSYHAHVGTHITMVNTHKCNFRRLDGLIWNCGPES